MLSAGLRFCRFRLLSGYALAFIASGLATHGAWAQRQPRPQATARTQPNIVLIITDDQGYGDLGAHGNPLIKTPHLDAFVKQSARLKNFYVSPVCSPTRASLLTGRYNYRTGVVDTYLGRSMMHPDETTLAEILERGGYTTGIFGKWHLGDNYPLRAIDQGFQVAQILKGGGLAQPADPVGSVGYFNPILMTNGREQRFEGYCSDIFTNAAIEFMGAAGKKPFFTYLAFNAPHSPLEVPVKDLEAYKGVNLKNSAFPLVGNKLPEIGDPSSTAKVYAMVSNIDANVGRVLKYLDEHHLADNTIVIFMTDNGPASIRFNDGMRGYKGNTYEGGIKVPCYIRWPSVLRPGHTVEQIAAHIDILPTLVEAAGLELPSGLKIDGRSLLPLLRGIRGTAWTDRALFFQWHRGDEPELGRAFAVRTQKFKLVGPEPIPKPGQTKLELRTPELYDLETDPFENQNIADYRREMVAILYDAYRSWFRNVSATRGYDPPRIVIGTPNENPTVLTRQDWRGPRASWNADGFGGWELNAPEEGTYDVAVHFTPRTDPSVAHLGIGKVERQSNVEPGSQTIVFRGIALPPGPCRLETWIGSNKLKSGGGVLDVSVTRVDMRKRPFRAS